MGLAIWHAGRENGLQAARSPGARIYEPQTKLKGQFATGGFPHLLSPGCQGDPLKFLSARVVTQEAKRLLSNSWVTTQSLCI